VAKLLEPFAGPRASEVATQLLDHFGSLDRAISASDEQILKACTNAEEVGRQIVAARELVQTALRERVVRSPVRSDDPALQEYLALKLRGKPHEELHAIFVDGDSGYIREELIAIGDSRHVGSRSGPIITRAIELCAAGFFLAHNHPSRHPSPSSDDVRSTLMIMQVAQALDLVVFDHFIIAGNTVTSMRGLGLL
jgi:DNA repair protein RadC